MSGYVYLVGAGPGDPGLITVAATQALAQADVVVYDRLVNARLLDLAPATAERVYVGKMPDRHTLTQDDINALLVERAQQGEIVVRLKGGDPFVFGRGGEEAQALVEAGLLFEVIPGVTSAIAAAAYAGIPVTHRGVAASVAFVTGHEDPTKDEQDVDWAKLATAVDTLVLMMSVGQLDRITGRLIAAGRPADTPVAAIEWGTHPRQRTVTATLDTIVATISDAGLSSPALIVVGDVVNLRDTLNWFETRPLFGQRVLVTRTRQQASDLSRALSHAGAEAIELPTIAINERYDEAQLSSAIDSLKTGDYSWLIFTSTNAVDIFFGAMEKQQLDTRSVRASVAAIGPATEQALKRHGISVDISPERYTTEGLLDALDADMNGQRVLVPCAEGARAVLADELGKRGADVDEVTVYVAQPPTEAESPELAEGLRRLRSGEIDIATFASSSSVTNLAGLLGEDIEPLKRCRIACIGPVTAATAEEVLGRAPDIIAEEHTITGLVHALETFANNGSG